MRDVEVKADNCQQDLDDPFFLHNLLECQVSSYYREQLTNLLGVEVRNATFAKLKEGMIFIDHIGRKRSDKDLEKTKENNNQGDDNTNKNKCGICGKKDHRTDDHKKGYQKKTSSSSSNSSSSSSSSSSTSAKNSNLEHITCHVCQQKGHYANRCPSRGTTGAQPPRNGSLPPSTYNSANLRQRVLAMRETRQLEGAGFIPTPDADYTAEMVAQAIYEMEERQPPNP